MGYVRMDLTGSDDIRRALDALSEAPHVAVQALRAGAEVLLPVERAGAPVTPGGGTHIRDRLEIRVKTSGGKPVALVGVWGEPVAYYVEHGHGGPHPAPAHPYMRPAAEAAEDDVTRAILDVVNRWLEGGMQ